MMPQFTVHVRHDMCDHFENVCIRYVNVRYYARPSVTARIAIELIMWGSLRLAPNIATMHFCDARLPQPRTPQSRQRPRPV